MTTNSPKRTGEDLTAAPGPSGDAKRPKTDVGPSSRKGCTICHNLKQDLSKGIFQGVVFEDDCITAVTLPKNKKIFKNILEPFFQAINALLNTTGTEEGEEGKVFIHTSNPHLLGEFDKKVDDKLLKLIPDGSLFDENYKRVFYDKNHVVFKVKLRTTERPPSTTEFRTKISVNKGIVDPTHTQMKRFMDSLSRPPKERPAVARPLPEFVQGQTVEMPGQSPPDMVPFQESHNMQAKPAKARIPQSRYGAGDQIDTQLNIWWDEHNLPHYISAFTKQQGGGSILLGVKETVTNDGKSTGKFICQGPVLQADARERVKNGILRRVRDDMKWSKTFTRGVVDVDFHTVRGGEEGECVVEVKVNYFHGLSFYKGGPLSYELRNKSPTAYKLEEWQQKMFKH